MTFKKREGLLEELRLAKSALEKEFRITQLALFGSWARGEQTSESDVDILVEIDPVVGLEFVTLAERLEERLGLPVELISRRAVSPRHWNHIKDELIYV